MAMPNGRVARRLSGSIGHYQHWRAARAPWGRCRFEPTCSHFAQDALHTRTLPVAIATSAWRVTRCNLLAPTAAVDPVRRGRPGLRPNTLATLLAFVSLVGIVVLLSTAPARAQSINGGCSASVNGHDPTTMTKTDPLVVHKGESVAVKGTVPASVAATPADQITSLTHIKVSIVEGLVEPTSEDHAGTGPEWGSSVDVDNYLKWGVGLYKVEGSSSGQPGGWSCSGDGYVKLDDGSPLSKPVGQAAAAVAVLGAGGALLAAGRSREHADLDVAPAPTAKEVTQDFVADGERVLGIEDKPAPPPPPPRPTQADLNFMFLADLGWSFGCGLVVLIAAMIISVAVGAGPLAIVPLTAAVAAEVAPRPRGRVWVRGRPVLAFFSGLVAGIGLAVVLQQFAYWPLTIATAIVFPVLVAILCTLRALRGRPFAVKPAA